MFGLGLGFRWFDPLEEELMPIVFLHWRSIANWEKMLCNRLLGSGDRTH